MHFIDRTHGPRARLAPFSSPMNIAHTYNVTSESMRSSLKLSRRRSNLLKRSHRRAFPRGDDALKIALDPARILPSRV
jgi:hypothetical protein